MRLNHVANRLDPRHFETVVEMLKAKLGFVELRRTERAIWLRQPGTNVDLQFSLSDTTDRAADKMRSQVSFLNETPQAALEDLATWAQAHGMKATVGSYSDKEFFLDAPVAFVDFVIEAMTPDLADYGVEVPRQPVTGAASSGLPSSEVDAGVPAEASSSLRAVIEPPAST